MKFGVVMHGKQKIPIFSVLQLRVFKTFKMCGWQWCVCIITYWKALTASPELGWWWESDCLLYRAPNAVFSWGFQLFSCFHFSLCSTPRPSTGGSPWGISLKATSSQQGSRHGLWRLMMWPLRWFRKYFPPWKQAAGPPATAPDGAQLLLLFQIFHGKSKPLNKLAL